jgi:hypothetical protein
MKKNSEFKKFDDAVKSIINVSKAELKRREEEWKKNRATKKKRAS